MTKKSDAEVLEKKIARLQSEYEMINSKCSELRTKLAMGKELVASQSSRNKVLDAILGAQRRKELSGVFVCLELIIVLR